jgi:Tfp pilus assembly protein PilP
MKMKPAITITTAILVSALAAGLASAQSPTIIQNTRSTMNGVSANQTAASNAALGGNQSAPASTTAISIPVGSGRAPTRTKSSAGTKHRRVAVVAGTLSAPPKPGMIVPKDAPAAPAVAANSGSGEGENLESEQSVVPDSKYNANGRRDPFLSPVVSHAGGSGCSTGKKCLEIGAINLRGVVHSENGFIAVVSNSMNKAYFLRENDPVFNGYVVKITGDSIVFQETLQDRLGKTFTREVVKKITTPAV